MICKSCFGIVQKDAAFCRNCGTRVDGEIQQQSQNNYQSQPQDTHQPYDEFQPHLPPPPVQHTGPQPAQGLATASMVMGILALTIMGPLGGILGLIFALVARSQGNRSGQATAGLVMSIISLVLWGIGVISCIICFAVIEPHLW